MTTNDAGAGPAPWTHRRRGRVAPAPQQPLVQRGAPSRWLIALVASLLPGSMLALPGLGLLRRERARQDLGRAARGLRGRDPLTRLYDSAEFISQSRRELVRTVDMQCPISLILVDPIDVAAIHRTHGVQTVNRALACVADACVSRLRGYDVVGRLDGRLIAILLPGADARRAQAVARSLQRRIAAVALDTPSAGVPLRLGASIGVATRTGYDENLGILIARARHSLAGPPFPAQSAPRGVAAHGASGRA
ncbi:MAG: GGDEF domain-containing protein [Lautropia sp.]